jgi:hypothetical protein
MKRALFVAGLALSTLAMFFDKALETNAAGAVG